MPKVKSAANFMECVASLVVMPDGGSQVFVAFPICQVHPSSHPMLVLFKIESYTRRSSRSRCGTNLCFCLFTLQEMPLFRRNPILEAMKKRQELAAMPASENDAPVPEELVREGSTSASDEVRIPIEVDADAHESVVALVRMPSMTSSEGSIHEDGLEMGPGDESDNETEDSDAAAAAAFVVNVGGDEAQ
jgi:hypothetical protein